MACLGYAGRAACFLLLGSWWTYRVLRRYFVCLAKDVDGLEGGKDQRRYHSSASFSCSRRSWDHLEALLKVFVPLFAMTDEFMAGWTEASIHSGVEHAQHAMIFFFFMLSGLADLDATLLPDLDYVTLTLATVMHAFSIFHDLHGRNSLDSEVHMFLFYVVLACAVSTALEMCFKNNVLPALCRCYFTLLQGTWYYQIRHLTSHPGEEWEVYSPSQQLVALLFTWHVAGVFFLLIVCAAFVRRTSTPEPSIFSLKIISERKTLG
ncbi:transmembrane protein 45B-like [Penaeus japonicus]|uniref:transmembrane protein 45B-like n=1 Tax=Penaeus japonicus TaxID=27405 RepID=UPI001C7140E2|nr:transmembrane protein 45B-like [Penaeus japonicus]XP_042868917.1 transmembrane protein 45B-like [Penaeus japonicus]